MNKEEQEQEMNNLLDRNGFLIINYSLSMKDEIIRLVHNKYELEAYEHFFRIKSQKAGFFIEGYADSQKTITNLFKHCEKTFNADILKRIVWEYDQENKKYIQHHLFTIASETIASEKEVSK